MRKRDITRDYWRLQSSEHCPKGQLQPAWENTRLLEITRDYRAQHTVLKFSSNLLEKTRDYSRLQSPEHCPEGQLQPVRENLRLLKIIEPRTLSWMLALTCMRKHEITRDYRAQHTVLKVSSNLYEKTRAYSRLLENGVQNTVRKVRLQSPEHCPEGQLQPARENTRLLEITEPRTLYSRSAPTCARKHDTALDFRVVNTGTSQCHTYLTTSLIHAWYRKLRHTHVPNPASARVLILWSMCSTWDRMEGR